jgi:hypothetical protein
MSGVDHSGNMLAVKKHHVLRTLSKMIGKMTG